MASLICGAKNQSEDEFINGLNSERVKFTASDKYTVIMYANNRGWMRVLKESIYWIYDVGYNGYWEALYIYFKKYNHLLPLQTMKFDKLLVLVARKLGNKSNCMKVDYAQCVDLLIDFPNVNINYLDDYQCTAIVYTVKYKNDVLTWKLMSNNAYIGLCVNQIKPQLLEEYLNRSLQSTASSNDDYGVDSMMSFNYKCFIKPLSLSPKILDSCDTDVMWNIANNKKLKYLISHPIFAYLIWTKWNGMHLIIWWNYTLCVFLIIIDIYLAIYYKIPSNGSFSQFIRYLVCIFSYFGWLILIFRCGYGFKSSQKNQNSFNNLKNSRIWLHFILILCLSALLLPFTENDKTERTLSALIFLLSAFELNTIFESFHHLAIATYVEMFKTVVKSFLKLLFVFSWIVVSFILSFYVLFRQLPKTGMPSSKYTKDAINETIAVNSSKTEEVNKKLAFQTFFGSSIKTIVMLTGEYNSDDMHFEENYFFDLIFVFFLFFVSLVLLNLLNGLAVTDAQEIRSRAEHNRFCYSVRTITKYESNLMLVRYFWQIIHRIYPKFSRKNINKVLPLTNIKEIHVYPNVPKTVVYRIEHGSVPDTHIIRTVDLNIVEKCYEMFKKRDEEYNDFIEKEKFEKWKLSMEYKVDTILSQLQSGLNLSVNDSL